MGKIVLEIEIDIPDNFDLENKQWELRQLESYVKAQFEEITGYSIMNIYSKIEDI